MAERSGASVNRIDVGRLGSEIGLGIGRDDPPDALAEFLGVRTGHSVRVDRLVNDQRTSPG